jgi:hypothetical protein
MGFFGVWKVMEWNVIFFYISDGNGLVEEYEISYQHIQIQNIEI